MMSAHENCSRRYANFYAFVKNFLGRMYFNDLTGGGPVGNRPMLREVLLTQSASLSLALTRTQWLASTIYEDKGT
jgi:hypothetical protein